MIIDVVEIQKILPHRFPFLLIDRVTGLISGVSIEAYKNVTIGDMEDVAKTIANVDIIVTNEHGKQIASKSHKVLIIRGFPIFETVGSALKSDILYEGLCSFLFECANAIEHAHS